MTETTTAHTENTPVNHPVHYNAHPSGIEAIEIVRHFGFDVGNTIKYLWRAGLKVDLNAEELEAEIQDCEKALWYLQDHLATLRTKKPRKFCFATLTGEEGEYPCVLPLDHPSSHADGEGVFWYDAAEGALTHAHNYKLWEASK